MAFFILSKSKIWCYLLRKMCTSPSHWRSGMFGLRFLFRLRQTFGRKPVKPLRYFVDLRNNRTSWVLIFINQYLTQFLAVFQSEWSFTLCPPVCRPLSSWRVICFKWLLHFGSRCRKGYTKTTKIPLGTDTFCVSLVVSQSSSVFITITNNVMPCLRSVLGWVVEFPHIV